MSLTNETRISFQMPAYGWLIVVDALEKYLVEHGSVVGSNDLEQLIDCIQERVSV